ncbi:MAG: AraC family transcriptional regulator [Pseudonocardia sp.]|nr:AraC family transcriptional regulator [Pseudonocardia sp.]
MRTTDLLDEIRGIIAARAGPDGQTSIAGLLLSKAETETPDHSLTDPLLVVMAQEGKRLLLGDQVFQYRAGQCLVVTTDLPVTGHFLDTTPQTPSLAMGLVLRPAAIAPLLLEAPAGRWSRGTTGLPAIATGEAGPDLLDAVARMLRAAQPPGGRSRARPADRAGDPLAIAHRPARRHDPPDRPRRQQLVPRQPGN